MKRSNFGLGLGTTLASLALAISAPFQPAALAQSASTGAVIHGHVQNAAGVALKVGNIRLTVDANKAPKDRVYKYTFPLDADGNYKGTDIFPGTYLAVVAVEDSTTVDSQVVTLRVSEDHPMDFDMTRAEYIKDMTPEQRAILAEFKKKNSAVTGENAKIADINKTLLAARADMKNGKPDEAVKALKPLVEQKADEAVLWASLGEAQLASGDAAVKAARAARTPANDPSITQNYTDAAVSYQKAITLNATSKKQSPENLAAYQLNYGQSLAKSGKLSEAADAYEASAKASPTMAASAYFNEAAVFFNAQDNDRARAAAEKAIAADPKRADAYYIKAQTLIGKATADPKTGKFILPAGCLESYQEYLDLDPTGQHAAEVKELLVGLGQPVKNSFKAGRK